MSFRDFARAYGVEITDMRTGDRIHRCGTSTHPTSKNGAYFFDGQRGWVQNWETGESPQWWNDPHAKPWSDTEKREWAARRQAADAEKLRGYELAATKATATITSATHGTHGYLKKKGFPDAPALLGPDGELLIPMRDFQSNRLVGIQTTKLVDNKWEKKMSFGMKAKGAVFRIGPQRAAEAIFCEGYATGLSIDAAARLLRLNACTVVCFSVGNLAHVANAMTGARYVFADNDLSMAGEKAAQDTGLPYVMSDQVGEDANDLHQRAGLMAVATKLMAVRKAATSRRA